MKTLLIILMGLSLAACKQSGGAAGFSEIIDSDGSTSAVFVIGDSGAADSNGYGKMIADDLGLPVENFSLANFTNTNNDLCTSQIFALYTSAINRIGVNSVIVYVMGFNDARFYGVAFPTVSTENCADEMLALFAGTGAQVFIAPTYYPHANAPSVAPFNQGSTAAFTSHINVIRNRLLGRYSNVHVVDLVSMQTQDSYFDINHLWPSLGGHIAIASDFLNAMGR